jgi:hypothetical protein
MAAPSRTPLRRLFIATLALASLTATSLDAEDTAPEEKNGLKLLFSENFEKGADRWEPTDPKAWKVIEKDNNHVFSQHIKNSDYKPPHRSPFNRAMIKDLVVGSFILDVKLQSTIPDYVHRDLCLFFGSQDPAHLYYVHLGKRTDPHANNVFIVNAADRKSISITTTEGTPWDDDWHHVRLIRDVKSGKIEVYFDDMQKPAMTAEDKTFTWGRVGIGSFDDTGNFDDVRVWGEKAEAK